MPIPEFEANLVRATQKRHATLASTVAHSREEPARAGPLRTTGPESPSDILRGQPDRDL
jgi:hypothetical protein